ncbi:MAG: hypothetical protein ACI8UO_002162 [Verrucomicrobiales bacterium]|jgi:hypothetical protein
MFIPEPSDIQVPVYAFVLWDSPDMAGCALELCNGIEQRVENIKFHLSEADANDIVHDRGVAPTDTNALEADLLLVAFQEMAKSLPNELKQWFKKWSTKRKCDYGALAKLDAPTPLSRQHEHELAAHSEARWPDPQACESGFRQFLQQTAERAKVDFISGALEADLEEATRNLCYLPAQAFPYSHAHL